MQLYRNHSLVFLGSGNSLANWSIGFFGSPNNDTSHSIIEIAINITMDSIYDGDSRPEDMDYKIPVGTVNNTIRIAFQAGERICDWDIPKSVDYSNTSTYAEIIFTPESWLFPFLLLSPEESENIPFANIEIIMIIALSIAGIIIYTSNRIKKN
jgi:hypothetical protein